jgi:hypothetical protein
MDTPVQRPIHSTGSGAAAIALAAALMSATPLAGRFSWHLPGVAPAPAEAASARGQLAALTPLRASPQA